MYPEWKKNYRILVAKCLRRQSLEHLRTQEDKIKINLKDMGYEDMNWL
jgi:hypothetical protein